MVHGQLIRSKCLFTIKTNPFCQLLLPPLTLPELPRLLLFFLGFVIAGYLAYAKFFMAAYRMTERPLFYFGLLAMILGTQLFLTGFLAELISLQTRDKQLYQIKETINQNKDNHKE